MTSGPKGIRTDTRVLDPLPSAHPALLRGISTFEGVPYPLDQNKDKAEHDRVPPLLDRDIRENKDMLVGWTEDKEQETMVHYGWIIGAAGAVTVLVSATALYLWRVNRRSTRLDYPPPYAPPQLPQPLLNLNSTGRTHCIRFLLFLNFIKSYKSISNKGS